MCFCLLYEITDFFYIDHLVATAEDQKIVKIPGQTLLPMSPLPPTHFMVKTSEANKSNKYKPPQIKPNGIPGRRPMLPTVDMDANEVMKVPINF